ncbi:hypothetical protein LCGC14_0622040 [marine sediment metagenome]|uniref:LamG-like jellyroll fold domain-containing protein n=1 Tax=marine sediment metagenome TaxID=412755 RepID=A0A0F9RNV8_9ZZZZ|nr:LamG domain-containing protein [Pricia sp.]
MAWVYHNKPPMGWPLDLSEPINDGLVGYWYMPEGSGNIVNDLSGNGNTGTFVANAHFVPGKLGPAVNLDGTGDAISLGNIAILNGVSAFTISIWVKKGEQPFTTSRHIISKDGGGDDTFRLFSGTTDRISFFVNTTGGEGLTLDNADTTITDLNWHHIVAIYTGANLNVYLDNILSVEQPAITGTVVATAHDFTIGARSGGSSQVWLGDIDHAMIFNRALSASEIALLYQFPFYGFLNPDEIPVLDQYYDIAVGTILPQITNAYMEVSV